MKFWRRKHGRKPDWPWLPSQWDEDNRPGCCGIRMRSPGAISSFWRCDLPASHDGDHRWEIRLPDEAPALDGKRVFSGSFTTEAAIGSWGRRASVSEMQLTSGRGWQVTRSG